MASENIVKLNVGGKHYETLPSTLSKIPNSFLARLTSPESRTPTDSEGRHFIDRDGKLFRYILDFHRYGRDSLPVEDSSVNLTRLRAEASYFDLKDMIQAIDQIKTQPDEATSCITIGYRGTFGSSRDSGTNLRFRKMSRILVCGQTPECRRVFGDNLNDTRDPDSGSNYSCRFFLKHTNLEHAFDTLYKSGYDLVTCCASGTNGSLIDYKGGQDEEEARWQHYNEFIFVKKV